MDLDLSTYFLREAKKFELKMHLLNLSFHPEIFFNPPYPTNAQLTFCDENGATATKTSPGGSPIAIVSIANGVVGSAPSKDTSKTSSNAAAKKSENQRTEETGGGGSEGKSEVTK